MTICKDHSMKESLGVVQAFLLTFQYPVFEYEFLNTTDPWSPRLKKECSSQSPGFQIFLVVVLWEEILWVTDNIHDVHKLHTLPNWWHLLCLYRRATHLPVYCKSKFSHDESHCHIKLASHDCLHGIPITCVSCCSFPPHTTVKVITSCPAGGNYGFMLIWRSWIVLCLFCYHSEW